MRSPPHSPHRLWFATRAHRIPSRTNYIVVFKPGIAREAALAVEDTVTRLKGVLLFRYTSALNGFSAKLPPEALETLRAAPGVAYIEADKVEKAYSIELNAPTGLQRTSKRHLPLPMNGQYTYSETGAGVNAYVIDSGIRVTHTEFGGRASGAVDEVHDGNGTNDCDGHGTHVAGVIGGANYGIAKKVHLYAVRVLDCTGHGTTSGLIAGVDWVTSNAIHPAVANMSVGGPLSAALDTAVTSSIASGVTYVVAAGNSSDDACSYSPSDLGKAATNPTITVGNTDPTHDTTDPQTNVGTCLELFAPGVNILSAWNTSDTASNSTSGTSESAPHVTGVAAPLPAESHGGNPGRGVGCHPYCGRRRYDGGVGRSLQRRDRLSPGAAALGITKRRVQRW